MKEIKEKNTKENKTVCQPKMFTDKENRLIEMKDTEKKIYFNITKNREFTIKL